ncbi:DUF1441 family protein [Methylococcus capsulatus]|uniref:DUF1441 family protein n=1 Tax=Methylococcus capsulatus TaxID=414 RepID=UPI001C529889|nr:DUF1441 family protein [Methylococcus capsulatus]QXP90016.1 DUF1441 family protein [Methylococcus capsulatus]
MAREFGLDRATVRKRLEGIAAIGESAHGHKLYALRDAAPAIYRQPSTVSAESADFDPDLLPPSDRKAWYEAEFKKRQLQELDGELMRGEVHEREMAEVIKIVVAGLERLPDLLERDAGISGKAVIKCRDIIDDLRNAVYQELVSGTHEDDMEPI